MNTYEIVVTVLLSLALMRIVKLNAACNAGAEHIRAQTARMNELREENARLRAALDARYERSR
jgi:hypothetical protein